jgi:hypothetical protein
MSSYDILKIFENLINESDVTSKEQENQIELSKELSKYKAKSKKKKKKNINQNKNEEDNELEKDKEEDVEDVETDRDDDDDFDEDSDEAPGTIHLEDALNYSKLRSVLNKFRASHSLKDPEIKEELEQYYSRLSKNEKMALYVFVKGLVQITGDLEADGGNANIPPDFGLAITKPNSSSREKKKSKEKKLKSKEKSKDDMSPIKVGESVQDKRKVYKVLLENK